MTKTIFITGGAGFVGSMLNLMLHDLRYKTIVYDNLSLGSVDAVPVGTFIQGDLSDQDLLNSIFNSYRIDAVMHLAALIDVGESVKNPSLYYNNNVVGSLVLLEAMRKARIHHLIFSSTAAVYGLNEDLPLSESTPCKPINPYGDSKWMTERILLDYSKAYELNSCSLRYFNAAGGDPSGRIKYFWRKEHNLIPLILNGILKKEPLTIYGADYPTKDGTCIRDYIHIADLGKAHILAMEKLFSGNASFCYNLGNGCGYSVLEVIKAAEQVTKSKVQASVGPRREGDPAVLLAASEKAKRELGWNPDYPELTKMIEHAWKARHE